jgi:hypothetical protein
VSADACLWLDGLINSWQSERVAVYYSIYATMKKTLILSSLTLCSALFAQAVSSTNASAAPMIPATSPSAQTTAVAPAAPVQYLRYSADLAVPLITPEMRSRNDRIYRNIATSELVSKAEAVDSYIFDGLRLARLYGPKTLKEHRHHRTDPMKELQKEYSITPIEARAWLEASIPLLSDHMATPDDMQQNLIPQAMVIYEDVRARLGPIEAARVMPGTSAYYDITYRPAAPVVVPAPQPVMMAPPPPVIVAPAPVVPAPAIGIGIGVGHRW